MRLNAALCCLAALLVTFGARAQQQAPQTFLLGAWTGGIFPPPTVVTADQCLAQPTVIFTRDVVMRASLMELSYIQRVIETVRGTGNGLEIRFDPAAPTPSSALTGFSPSDTGFGCDSPDALHVERVSQNQIRFPGCSDFPFPLVRCPAG